MNETQIETNIDYKKAFEEIAGARTIAFNTAFAKLLGSIAAGLLLSQAAYYEKSLRDQQKSRLHDKNGEPNLFWWHTDKQWREETTLSAWELRAAKKLLYSSKVLCSVIAGMPYETFYRVDFKRLAELLNSSVQTSEFHLSRKEDSACIEKRNPPLIKDKGIKETLIPKERDKKDKDIEFSSKILASASPETQETFDGKVATAETSTPKAAAKGKGNLKEIVLPEAAAIRRSIAKFLALKCYHARDESEEAILLGNQIAQLNSVAKTRQLMGGTLQEVEQFWNWFTTGGDFRGTNYMAKEKQGIKTSVPPSVVSELWLSFKRSKPVSAAVQQQGGSEEAIPEVAFKIDFETILLSEGIEYGDADYILLKTNYLAANPSAAAEVTTYEQARN